MFWQISPSTCQSSIFSWGLLTSSPCLIKLQKYRVESILYIIRIWLPLDTWYNTASCDRCQQHTCNPPFHSHFHRSRSYNSPPPPHYLIQPQPPPPAPRSRWSLSSFRLMFGLCRYQSNNLILQWWWSLARKYLVASMYLYNVKWKQSSTSYANLKVTSMSIKSCNTFIFKTQQKDVYNNIYSREYDKHILTSCTQWKSEPLSLLDLIIFLEVDCITYNTWRWCL